MDLLEEGYLLRIFIGESDRRGSSLLYEWIVRLARERGLAGATVLRGIMGYGANSNVIHTFRIERLSEDLPVVIEIVDTKARLNEFLAEIDGEITAGLATLEKAEVRFYRSNKKDV